MKKNLRSIYERAKAAIQNGESSEVSGQERQPVLFDGKPPPSRRLDSEAQLLLPPSFLASYGAHKGSGSEGHVLPVEHLLVHRELKKIHTFCQSGKASALRNLFQMLKQVDHTLKQGGPDSPGEEPA